MSDFWTDKRVVITGGGGMMGSRLAEFLDEAGASVLVMDNMSRGKYWANGSVQYVPFPIWDATNLQDCKDAFKGADVVFNLAAHVGGVYHNLAHQLEQFWENAKLQTVPARAAAGLGVPVFLQTSTVCVYADGYNNPAREQDGHVGEPEAANAGYAWAKRLGERICAWAFEGTDTRWIVVRPTNAYGIRDYFDERAHVIPALVRKFEGGDNPVVVYGGGQMREFIYADDVARGMMVVAEKGECGEAYNLGTGGDTQVSMEHLAELIRLTTGHAVGISFVAGRPTGDKARCTDCRKARALGWKHKIDLPEGLKRVVEWYRASR